MRFGHLLLASAALAAFVALDARDARACGGCFPPPGEAQSVVTDHRMVLTVSQQQTTLYDQIRYSGNPSSFAWVLPIAGTVTVGLSADTVFQALENLTQTTVQQPPTGCPGPQNCNFATSGAEDAKNAGASGSSGSSGVDVLKQEVVGPYATVQLRSTDPQALDTWLTTNGFAIPNEVKPVISAYVAEKFDFLALKLLPGKDVTSMRPVRVTTPGATAVLPLRMVAAGTGANVGVALWVVGEGRYEPQNFPFFSLKNEDITWDWATNTSNYKELRAAKTIELAGRGWEIESSIDIDRTQFESIVQRVAQVRGGADYAPIEDNGQLVKSADQVRREDMEAFFSGLTGRTRVTRTRADLSKAALANDLVMIASGDQSQLSNIRQPKLEKGQPTCTVYSGCSAVGQAPRDEVLARQNGGNESFSCKSAARRVGTGGFVTVGGLAALAGILIVRARRRSRG